jgi:putative phage-type endonuclease
MITTEQLATRHLSIGGSDAPAICGMGAFSGQNQTPLGMYLEKTRQIEPEVLTGEQLYWGNQLEGAVLKAYSEKTGLRVNRVNNTVVHPNHSFLTANLDGRVIAHPDGIRVGVEAKTTGEFAYLHGDWGDEGTDEVPNHVLIQCLHYLGVTGWDRWDVAVLIGGNKHRIYHIPRNDDAIGALQETEIGFWDHVERRVPPPADFSHASTRGLIETMYPGTNGETILLGEDMMTIHEALMVFKAQEKEARLGAEAAKAALMMALGDNAVGVLPDGTGYVRKLVKGGVTQSFTRADRMSFLHTKNIK